MRRLIDTVVGFTKSGFAAAGSGSRRTANPAPPFTTVGQPVFNHVKGESGDTDFVETFTLGYESDPNKINIYQCESSAAKGSLPSQWYELVPDKETDLQGSLSLTVSGPSSTASALVMNYARKVSTGSAGFHAGTTSGSTSFTAHTFDLTGHASSIYYTQA
jgi:hypothetical protein